MDTRSVNCELALFQGTLILNALKNSAKYMSTIIPSIKRPQVIGMYLPIPRTKKLKMRTVMIPILGLMNKAPTYTATKGSTITAIPATNPLVAVRWAVMMTTDNNSIMGMGFRIFSAPDVVKTGFMMPSVS